MHGEQPVKASNHLHREELPLVSVILAVYNRQSSIGRAIDSVLAQTYQSIELIVVDDGSTDGTRSVIDGFGTRIKLISQEHCGVYPARNAGLRHARGELVSFIDSDDAWLPDKIAAQIKLARRPEVGLVFGDAIHVTAPFEGAQRTGLTSFQVSPPRRGRAADRFMWCNFVPTCTVLVRRTCLEASGGFSEASGISADYLAWFRIALYHELDYLDWPVAEYTVHADGISYDLGRSLVARIRLFSAERAQTTDPAASRVLTRLLFNLSLHLALAAVRGRARNVSNPLHLAWCTARGTLSFKAPAWIGAFAIYQLHLRARRLFS